LVCSISASGEGVSEAIIALVEAAAGPKEVILDIKPGSDPNSINCKNAKAVIPVAILTTDDFDALTVDHTTVTFEGASEIHKVSGVPVRHEEDVDGDGDIDLLYHFRLSETTLTCDSTQGTLIGETYDGLAIEGTDSIRMVESSALLPNTRILSSASVVISWSTDNPTTSEVQYGLQPGEYSYLASDPLYKEFHEVQLDGLTPFTNYYFIVQVNDLFGGSEESSEFGFFTGNLIFIPMTTR
jgi:hypothetical protein